MNDKKILIETSDNLDKEKLREIAITLEEQLKKDASKSKDVLALSEYAPLVSAIQRAKQGLIDKPEEIPNTSYWDFETEVGSAEFAQTRHLLSSFCLELIGWSVLEIPDDNPNA